MPETCPPTAHDYIVVSMTAAERLRCYYRVKCARCGDSRSGFYDEIPPARFDSELAEELLT